ncbi:LysR family transcriptional regulator [Shewanella eurypsychrophilus]|uniref:LysR family transcriptional regulator n=1 Tax=Shewanella eurypsychrophilus TaxID=2593656 RepID=A0ABX6VC93_9GAMM|nr:MULTISPECIES: LysR family transcriptional regulator [Shewanella]QFU22840.1 LysR family transcriptional regulator [Shewanella sp. YLB-09]QPG58127.1 LysR family transcriptional regulator [Shewanella eurypsychrophilus]
METNWLNYLPLYIQLCEERSIAATAKRLGCSNAHVSRQLVKLELLLNKQLIHRTTRKFVITADGQAFYRNAKALMEHADEVESRVFDSETITGKIRVSASASYGATRLSALMAKFSNQYPEIELELSFTEQPVDLIEQSYDLAVYLTDTPDDAYVGHRLKPVNCVPYAHKHYIEKHGEITHPNQLDNYNHIIYKSDILKLDSWQFAYNPQRHNSKIEYCKVNLSGNFNTNLIPSMVEAMLAGCGVAMLADFALDKLTNAEKYSLVRLLPDWSTTGILPLYILYPRRKHLPKRTSLLVEFLKAELG